MPPDRGCSHRVVTGPREYTFSKAVASWLLAPTVVTGTADQKADLIDRTGAHTVGRGVGLLPNAWLPSLPSMHAALFRHPKHNVY